MDDDAERPPLATAELPPLPIDVVMNARAGRLDEESARERIGRVLSRAGREHRLLAPAHPGELAGLVARLAAEARERPRIVAAAGGDGTLNTVAGALRGTEIPLGVIPLGTFNYFARDLGVPLDPEAAAAALLDGVVRRRHVADVNGRAFLVNASFGLYRRLIEDRERAKRRFGRNKGVAAASGLATLLRHQGSYAVELEVDGRPVFLRTPLLFFGFNALQLENLGLDVAGGPERGLLAVLALRPMGRLELLATALRGALVGLADEKGLVRHCASRATVRRRGVRRARVAVDGETCGCRMPLRFSVQRDALAVVVPRHPEPRR